MFRPDGARAAARPPRQGSPAPLGCSGSPAPLACPWVQDYVAGHVCVHSHQHTAAVQHFMSLEHHFPNNLHVLLQLAKIHLDLNQLDEAQYNFNKARVCDNLNLDMMDHYAALVRKRGSTGDLNRLAHDLLSTNQRRPEPWIAVALYSELRNEREKALGFIEKAIQVSSRTAKPARRSDVVTSLRSRTLSPAHARSNRATC